MRAPFQSPAIVLGLHAPRVIGGTPFSVRIRAFQRFGDALSLHPEDVAGRGLTRVEIPALRRPVAAHVAVTGAVRLARSTAGRGPVNSRLLAPPEDRSGPPSRARPARRREARTRAP